MATALAIPLATSSLSLSDSRRRFSVLNRPPPNYPGHVPLTRLERFGLAIGSGIGSYLDPYRGGKPVPSLPQPLHPPNIALFATLRQSAIKPAKQCNRAPLQTSSPSSPKQPPPPTSSPASATPCSAPPRAAASSATDRASPPSPSTSRACAPCPPTLSAGPTCRGSTARASPRTRAARSATLTTRNART